MEKKLNSANASPLEKLSARPGGHSEKEVTDWPTVGGPGTWDAPGDERKAGPPEKRAHTSDRSQGRCTEPESPQAGVNWMQSVFKESRRNSELDLALLKEHFAFSSLPAPHKCTPVTLAPPPPPPQSPSPAVVYYINLQPHLFPLYPHPHPQN